MWYAAAWAPYSLLYLAVFLGQQGGSGKSVGSALWSTAVNVSSAALIGFAVAQTTYGLALLRVRPSLMRMLANHAAASLVYSTSLYLTICTAFGLPALLTRGTWEWEWITGPGLLWQLLTGVMLYVTLAGLAHALGVTQQLRESEVRVHAVEALRARAELQALRAQVHPHFLFNTLHSVMALIRRDPPRAEAAVEHLAALLRYSLRRNAVDVDKVADSTMDEQLAFVRDYLALETLRYRERLEVCIAVEEGLMHLPVPSFTLQPLVENAIKHGISARRAGGRIMITSVVDGNYALLRVRADGLEGGFDEARALVDGEAGLGLHLVRERLRISFGERATVTHGRPSPTAFEVSVRFPLTAPVLTAQPAA